MPIDYGIQATSNVNKGNKVQKFQGSDAIQSIIDRCQKTNFE